MRKLISIGLGLTFVFVAVFTFIFALNATPAYAGGGDCCTLYVWCNDLPVETRGHYNIHHNCVWDGSDPCDDLCMPW